MTALRESQVPEVREWLERLDEEGALTTAGQQVGAAGRPRRWMPTVSTLRFRRCGICQGGSRTTA